MRLDQSEGLAVLLALLLPLLLTVDIASWCSDGILFEIVDNNQIRGNVIQERETNKPIKDRWITNQSTNQYAFTTNNQLISGVKQTNKSSFIYTPQQLLVVDRQREDC